MRIEEHACGGNCLEAIGIPDKGIAVIDRDMKPNVFDVVWCSGCVGGEIGGFLKEIIDTGHSPVVHTRYKDSTKNYAFFPKEIYGVVLKVMDRERNVVWERPKPTNADRIRAMTDEELAEFLLNSCAESKCEDAPHTDMGSACCYICRLNWLRQPVKEE